jgi:hypothetical protein
MSELLLLGSRGEEVRRLQVNLNAAIGKKHGRIAEDGKFGQHTREAVIFFQQSFRLKKIDGKVGPETRAALAMRVLLIEGEMSRKMSAPTPPPRPSPSPAPNPPKPPSPPAPTPPTPTASKWLLQLQPAIGLTPPVFVASPSTPTSSVVSGQLLLGLVYRTATDGPHWEFGFGAQPSFNSTNSVTDPRYTLQAQGSVAFADPFSHGRFHTQVFGQVVAIQNFAPQSNVAGLQLGGQLSVDIVSDRWNLFLQGALAGSWVLHDPSGGQTGLFSLGPVLGLGTTIQWGL